MISASIIYMHTHIHNTATTHKYRQKAHKAYTNLHNKHNVRFRFRRFRLRLLRPLHARRLRQDPYPGTHQYQDRQVSDIRELRRYNDRIGEFTTAGLRDFSGQTPIKPPRDDRTGNNIGWGKKYPYEGDASKGTGAGHPTYDPPYGGPRNPSGGGYGGYGGGYSAGYGGGR